MTSALWTVSSTNKNTTILTDKPPPLTDTYVPLPRTWVETTPKRCHQIKIMPFIQTGVTYSESAHPKTTTRYVYNMSLFLVARLLNRW
jgi:hypothetical protein